MIRRLLLPHAAVLSVLFGSAGGEEFPEPVNTQPHGEHPPAPHEMPDLFDLPSGFTVTLFAGEPDVRQPIAFDFDDRGRLWIAENYTYSARGAIDPHLRDRVIILADTDGDGRHDQRRVFWDKGRMLTGLTWGHGGLWILNDATLSFLPDSNGDDVPDSQPVVILDGWTKEARHNFVNGLSWGPDGWLHGRHGILDTSWPGTPGTPKEQRQPINCGIWRFHPRNRTFEVVCHGTVNPWGLDYNEHGQMFMTNNVHGHLWHVIPGAHYERMFGQDFNPHLYAQMTSCADHYHWDTTGHWTQSRDGVANTLGGGHSHCGGMIYLGQNFPEKYRGRMLMCNTHGRCVNTDRLERSGSGYVAKHEPDLLKVNTPWFRGIDLKYGPAGCVYLSDWADNGECHDHDGVHRTSGRIYRIVHGEVGRSAADIVDSLQASDSEALVRKALESESEWLRRRAARVLTERNPDSGTMSAARDAVKAQADQMHVLNAGWLLHSVDHVDRVSCLRLLESDFEHVRALAVRIISETPRLRRSVSSELMRQLRKETSAFVLMAYASAVRRLPLEEPSEDGRGTPGGNLRRHILEELCDRSPVSGQLDQYPELRKMIWYGVENSLQHSSEVAIFSDLTLRRWYFRRLASTDWRMMQFGVSGILQEVAYLSPERDASDPERLRARTACILAGLVDGLRGQRQVSKPADWGDAVIACRKLEDPGINRMLDELSILFGDGVALENLRQLVADRDGDHTARAQAIAVLAQTQDKKSIPLLLSLLDDRAVLVLITRVLVQFDDARIPVALLRRWNGLDYGGREAAIDTLASRRSWARKLAKAIDDLRVDASEMSAAQVRQLLALGDPEIRSVIETHWGILRSSPAAKAEAIAHWKARLTDDVLTGASREHGAAVFRMTCGNCHRLYGEGGTIGPDLTGANRSSMDYLLSNIVDPSAELAKQHAVTLVALTSGRVINGVVVNETDQAIVLQTDKEQVTIAKSDIEERVRTDRSLMPDGLLDPMSADNVRDLVAFLRQID